MCFSKTQQYVIFNMRCITRAPNNAKYKQKHSLEVDGVLEFCSMGIHVLRYTTLSLWRHRKKTTTPPSSPPSRGHGRGVANRLLGASRGRAASVFLTECNNPLMHAIKCARCVELNQMENKGSVFSQSKHLGFIPTEFSKMTFTYV